MQKSVTLDYDNRAISYLCKVDKRFNKVFSMIGPITYVIHEDGYVFLIHEIIEQMLSRKAANSIFLRLKGICNNNICPDSICRLSNDDIKNTGTSFRKVKTIRSLTDAIKDGQIILQKFPAMSDEDIIKQLTRIHGIGNWTAKMYLIFVLDRQDVLPYEDVAFLQGYKWAYKANDCSPAAVQKKCKKWKPYSSIAARYMYRALDTSLTKQEFHLFK